MSSESKDLSVVLYNKCLLLQQEQLRKILLMSTVAKTSADPRGQHPELYYQNLTGTHSQRQHMIPPSAH